MLIPYLALLSPVFPPAPPPFVPLVVLPVVPPVVLGEKRQYLRWEYVFHSRLWGLVNLLLMPGKNENAQKVVSNIYRT